MRFALPILTGRISPVFDRCTTLLVVQTDAEGELTRQEITFSSNSAAGRIDKLRQLEVETLICGGLSHISAMRLAAAGIKLISWVAGDTDEVVKAFIEGRLVDPEFSMPGCRCVCSGDEDNQEIGPLRDGTGQGQGSGRGQGRGRGRGRGRKQYGRGRNKRGDNRENPNNNQSDMGKGRQGGKRNKKR